MNDKRRGKVIELDTEQGYGVIIDENGQDIHFLLSTTPHYISINSKVIFQIKLSSKGLTAVDVELEIEAVLI